MTAQPERSHPTPLRVPTQELVEALKSLKDCASLPEVADQVSALEARLPLWAARAGGGRQTTSVDRQSLCHQLRQIAEAHTLARAFYYVDRLCKGLTLVKTSKLNDINLNRWQDYPDIETDSLWIIPRRDSSGAHKADYWGNFVPQIPHQMIRRYTRAGEWVLDAFAGSGTTLLECQRLGRHGVGVELQEKVAQHARDRVAREANPQGVSLQLICADSSRLDFSAALEGRKVQLALLHPPYHDIIRFSDDPRDLSNAQDVEGFLEGLGRVAQGVHQVLDRRRMMALVIGDKYSGSEWIPLGFQSMQRVLSLGFSLKSIIVKNFDATTGKRAQAKLWRYRALAGGFYLFKHEYIFLFQKL